jgi:hypothetical protein
MHDDIDDEAQIAVHDRITARAFKASMQKLRPSP